MLSVSEDTLKETTGCPKSFNCLSGETDSLCQVEYALKYSSTPIAFVEMPENRFCTCDYCGYFGTSSTCSCPIRIELFKRFSI
jgi:hypothetical protein